MLPVRFGHCWYSILVISETPPCLLPRAKTLRVLLVVFRLITVCANVDIFRKTHHFFKANSAHYL